MSIVKMQFGSHVYGTNIPTSDLDYKAIYMPKPHQIIMGTVKDVIQDNTKTDITKKSTQDDIECESFAFKRFIELLCQSQTVPVGMLFVPEKFYQVEPNPLWFTILEHKHKFLSSGVSAFVGYCRTQANKYGIKGSRVAASRVAVETLQHLIDKHGKTTKLRDVWQEIEDMVNSGIEHISIVEQIWPELGGTVRLLEVCNRKAQEHVSLKEAFAIFDRAYQEYGHRARQAEKNENIDWKALMHACRVYTETKELLAYGKITYPRPDADFLMKVRLGEMDYKFVAEYLEHGLEELEELVPHSVLNAQPDLVFANTFIYQTYLKEIKCEL